MKTNINKQTPVSWEWVFLKDIATISAGNPAPQGTDKFIGGKYPFVRVKDMGALNGNILITVTVDKVNEKGARTLKLFKKGSVLFTKSGASTLLNQRAILGQDSYVVSHIAVAELHKGILSKWLYYWLITVDFCNYAHGANMPSLPLSKANTIEVPVAPENEQHRIVAKIEELFSELDKGVESLTTARKQLALYRQSLLKHAFAGKLTKKWRAEHAGRLETTDQLLARIKKEREKRYQQHLTAWEKAVEEWKANGKEGKRPAKPRKLKELPEITQKESKYLPKLPDDWRWIKVDKIHNHEPNAIKAGPFGSALKKAYYVPSGYKIYGQEQVISGDWEFGNYFINEKKYFELENCKVAPNDILISLVGTVGKVLILPDNILEGVINPRLIKISPNLSAYHPVFFKYYFESHFLKDLYKLQTHGATMDVLNLGIIQKLPFPLCSMKEQLEIVKILDLHFSIIEQLEAIIEDNLIAVKLTRQSILKKAFSGQLVPQDPDDEPASELLARIREERDKIQQETRKRPRKRRKKKEVKTMANLLEIVRAANDWLSAQDAFRQCGIGDGAKTDAIEKIYEELRDNVNNNLIAVERRGDEDWLRAVQRG